LSASADVTATSAERSAGHGNKPSGTPVLDAAQQLLDADAREARELVQAATTTMPAKPAGAGRMPTLAEARGSPVPTTTEDCECETVAGDSNLAQSMPATSDNPSLFPVPIEPPASRSISDTPTRPDTPTAITSGSQPPPRELTSTPRDETESGSAETNLGLAPLAQLAVAAAGAELAPAELRPNPDQLPRDRATLQVRRFILCDRIDGLARVHPSASSHIRPGQNLLLYAELAGVSEGVGAHAQERVIKIAATLELWPKDAGAAAWSQALGEAEDQFATPRQAHFAGYRMKVPNLPPGDYELRLVQTDILAGVVAETSTRVTIVPLAP
jgi:hypothetical protein